MTGQDRTPVTGILICGTSHTGKTTLAGRIAPAAGANVIATDGLARHPGRPWPEVRPQVAEFYESLSAKTIHWFLKVHHENMQCHIHHAIEGAMKRDEVFVIEGAALRPELYGELLAPRLIGICLHADPEIPRHRILKASDHANRDRRQQRQIDAFIERSLRENTALHAAAAEHGFATVDVTDSAQDDDLAARLVQTLKPAG